MRISFYYGLFVFLLLFFIVACEDQPAKENPEAVKNNNETSIIEIANQKDLESVLSGIDIPVYPDAEFIGLEQRSPSLYDGKYKVIGNRFNQTENEFLAFYQKLFKEKLEGKGWKDNSLPGTGIINLSNRTTDVAQISLIITPSDVAKANGRQEITYRLNLKK